MRKLKILLLFAALASIVCYSCEKTIFGATAEPDYIEAAFDASEKAGFGYSYSQISDVVGTQKTVYPKGFSPSQDSLKNSDLPNGINEVLPDFYWCKYLNYNGKYELQTNQTIFLSFISYLGSAVDSDHIFDLKPDRKIDINDLLVFVGALGNGDGEQIELFSHDPTTFYSTGIEMNYTGPDIFIDGDLIAETPITVDLFKTLADEDGTNNCCFNSFKISPRVGFGGPEYFFYKL